MGSGYSAVPTISSQIYTMLSSQLTRSMICGMRFIMIVHTSSWVKKEASTPKTSSLCFIHSFRHCGGIVDTRPIACATDQHWYLGGGASGKDLFLSIFYIFLTIAFPPMDLQYMLFSKPFSHQNWKCYRKCYVPEAAVYPVPVSKSWCRKINCPILK